jgi:hypothetical protein
MLIIKNGTFKLLRYAMKHQSQHSVYAEAAMLKVHNQNHENIT